MEKKKKQHNVNEMVHVRNRFFYVSFRKLTAIFFASLSLTCVSLVFAFYFANKPVPPVYVPLDKKHGVLPTYPLNQISEPNEQIMNAKVSELAIKAAKSFYNLDYLKKDEQLNQAQDLFTYAGWNELLEDFSKAKTYETIGMQKMIVQLNQTGPVSIKNKGTDKIPGIYTWDVDFPAKIKFTPHDGVHAAFDKQVHVHIRVARMPTVDAPEGIAVHRMVIQDVNQQ